MAPFFRDEHIIIIAPGSHTTLAQLGLPESFTPARLRVKSRMFPAEKEGEWEPYKIRYKPKPKNATAEHDATDDGESGTYEEDLISDEGAVWPMSGGKITNWPCFKALMQHVHTLLGSPFHTPILLITEPVWTPKEIELLTQFFFEKFKMPALAVMDAAQAAAYAYGLQTATVVDVGADKADVTAIVDFLIHDFGRSTAIPGCGGEAMTQRLLKLLGPKGFTREMCEQLKRNAICEALPPGTPLPGSKPQQGKTVANPAAAASTGAEGSGPGQRHSAASLGEAARGPGPGTDVGVDDLKDDEDNEGVLDVANIVTSGKMTEFLARKEKEKNDRLVAKKKGVDPNSAAAAKLVKLKNSEKERNSFFYEDHALLDALKSSSMNNSNIAEARATLDEGPQKTGAAGETQTNTVNGNTADGNQNGSSSESIRREISVGTERFQALSESALTTLSSAIYRTIMAVPDLKVRAELWNSMVIIGNGAAVRGFKEALVASLNAQYLISPSSATIFTSEFPSNNSTPFATGANTPQPHQGIHSTGTGVNPLLYAATTASGQLPLSTPTHLHPQAALHHQQHQQHPQHFQTPQQHQLHPQAPQLPPPPQPQLQLPPQQHSSHGQSPTSIRLARLPEYFPEWKDHSHEEATFLGAQVAAKVIFVADSTGDKGGSGGLGPGSGKGFMSRSDYNENGPNGIHEYSFYC